MSWTSIACRIRREWKLPLLVCRPIVREAHSFKSREEQKTKHSVDRVSNILDSPLVSEDRNRPIRMRGKISKPLEKPRLELDDASQGMLDSTGMEVMEVMNEALQTDEFYQVFRGTESAADVVEIIDVKMNRDFSHAHAFWRSKVIEMCLENLLSKNLAPTDVKIAEKMLVNMTNILQRNEAKFRSHMVRRINFRRVPRIYFKHEKLLVDMLALIKEQNYVR